mmetsp:Transcript_31326/g.43602  ORF Transcript_31326/g.43602 Transcript_31326/m.43602 type:complete len:80 (-) Transcript_31326:353-592(-)
MKINNLTEPIDVYSEWIDETEKVNREEEEYARERESIDKALGNDQDLQSENKNNAKEDDNQKDGEDQRNPYLSDSDEGH